MTNPEYTPIQGPRHDAEVERHDLQQPMYKDFGDGIASTAGGSIYRFIRDEGRAKGVEHNEDDGILTTAQTALINTGIGVGSLVGMFDEEADYDKKEKSSELLAGIPYEYWDDILAEDNFAAATRVRARVLGDIERGKRMGAQNSGQAAMMAGTLVDVDAPLTLFSGGAYGTAKVTRATYRAATALGSGGRFAARAANTAEGMNAGFQAGVLVGSAEALASPSAGWEDFANTLLTATATGGALVPALKSSGEKAQQGFIKNIAENRRGFHEQLDVDQMPADDFRRYEQQPEMEQSLSAAQNPEGTNATVDRPELDETDGPISPGSSDIIRMAQDWRHNSDWADQKAADLETWWGKAASSVGANVFNQDFSKLFRSKSAVANYLAGTIFESANGLGRGKATAAVRQENYTKRIQKHIGRSWFTNLSAYSREVGDTMGGSGLGWTSNSKAKFSREVMLEMNDRRMGRTPAEPRSLHVQRTADQLEAAGQEAGTILKGRDGERSVDGFEDFDLNVRGYSPQRMNGNAINRLIRAGTVTHDSLVADVAIALERAGMAISRDAEAISDAMIKRAKANDADMETNVASLLAADGQEWLRQALMDSGADANRVDGIMNRLVGQKNERSREGFTKSRNDLDWSASITTVDGSDVRIVDILDNDVHGAWQRYTRRVAGASALARHGITNRGMREEFITAIRKEQIALGEEPLEADFLRAILSNFDGAAIKGYANGRLNDGVETWAAVAKRMTNLGLLEQLGVTQIAELGMGIAQNGLANFVQRGLLPAFQKELRRGNREVLDELSFVTGEIGRDQWHFAQWLDMDDLNNRDRSEFMRGVNKVTGGMSALQAYTNAFNQMRSFQQRTAALGVSDKIFRTIKKSLDEDGELPASFKDRARSDLGLGEEDLQALSNLVENGTIRFDESGKFVQRLNIDQWDGELAEIFGASVTRNLNQIVQKTLAGEGSAWMHTTTGSLLMHLKSFAAASVQKQFARNLRYMDGNMVAMITMASATAALSVMVKNAINGRDQDPESIARAAFGYHNMFGWIPTVMDPMLSMVGLDEARMNPYGPNSSIVPPVVTVGADLMRAPGGLVRTATGTADYHDWKAVKATPFLGTYGLSNIFN